jgi:hypothetical protein
MVTNFCCAAAGVPKLVRASKPAAARPLVLVRVFINLSSILIGVVAR